VIAAAIVAVLASAGAIAFVTTGEGDWRAVTAAVVPAVLSVLAAYFTAPDAKQAEQAIAAGALPPAPAIRAGESPY
jgi:hypothetical protein